MVLVMEVIHSYNRGKPLGRLSQDSLHKVAGVSMGSSVGKEGVAEKLLDIAQPQGC